MHDREKVIKGLQNLREAIATDFIHDADQAIGTIGDALAMIDTQYKLILELQNLISIGTKMMNGNEA